MSFSGNFLISFARAFLTLSAGLLITKLIASTGGPEVLGKFSQWQAFLVISASIVTSVVGTGLVKYLSENRDAGGAVLSGYLWSGLAGALVFCACYCALCALIWPFILSLLGLEESNSIFLAALPLYLIPSVFNTLMQSFENGLGAIWNLTSYVVITAVNSVIVVVVGYLLEEPQDIYAYYFLFPLGTVAVLAVYYIRRLRLTLGFLHSRFDFEHVLPLVRFSVMPIVSLLCGVGVFILIRNDVAISLGWSEVGIWAGLKKISDAFIGAMTILFTTYYVPQLVRAQSLQLLEKEMARFAVRVLPIAFVMLTLVYLSRNFIIMLLFSRALSRWRPYSPIS